MPLRNDTDEIYGVAGVSRDITERKQADALRDEQARILEMIAMSAPLKDVLERLVPLLPAGLCRQAASASACAWARHHAASRRRNTESRQRADVRVDVGFCSTRWAQSSSSRARARYVSAKRWFMTINPC